MTWSARAEMHYYTAPAVLTQSDLGDLVWAPKGFYGSGAGWVGMQPKGGPEETRFVIASPVVVNEPGVEKFGEGKTDGVGPATKTAMARVLGYTEPLRGASVEALIGQVLTEPPADGWPAVRPERDGVRRVRLLRDDGRSEVIWSDAPAGGSAIDGRLTLDDRIVLHRADFSTPRRFRESLLDWFGCFPLAALAAACARWAPHYLPLFGAAILTDAFTNTNGTAITTHDSNYLNTKSSGQFIDSNALYQNGSSTVSVRWTGPGVQDDHYSLATVVAAAASGGSYIGLSVRGSSGSTSYVAFASATDNFYLRRTTTGSDVVIHDGISGTVYALNDVPSLEIVGSSLSLKRNGSHVGTSPYTDSNLTTGYPGTSGFGSGTTALRIDGLELGVFATPALLLRRDPMAHLLGR